MQYQHKKQIVSRTSKQCTAAGCTCIYTCICTMFVCAYCTYNIILESFFVSIYLSIYIYTYIFSLSQLRDKGRALGFHNSSISDVFGSWSCPSAKRRDDRRRRMAEAGLLSPKPANKRFRFRV